MTIKEATKKMLWQIKVGSANKENKYTVWKDKDIALKIDLTAPSYSRLATGVTTPKIITWWKIIQLHKKICGAEKTEEIINELCV